MLFSGNVLNLKGRNAFWRLSDRIKVSLGSFDVFEDKFIEAASNWRQDNEYGQKKKRSFICMAST